MAAKLFEPAEFTVFYLKYPKHTHRDEALGAWRKLAPNSELIATIMKDIETRQWPETQFVPNAATYLNKRRWLDESLGNSPAGPVRSHSTGAIDALHREAQRMARLTPAEIAANRAKLRSIIASIGDKGLR